MDPAILLIIVFIVAPLIERLLKAGKGAEQPPEQRPQQGPQQRIPEQRPPRRVPDPEMRHGREEPASASADDDAAAAMLPDDLWEILTGERRSPALPVPQAESEELEQAYAAEEYAEDARAQEMASREGLSHDDWTSRQPEGTRVVPHDAYVRPLPERDAPRVVSLEELEFDPEKRHDAFHDRLDTLGGPARVRRQKASSYRFTSDEDLRRAIVMNEILGTPKGLE
ncbi:MAG TPA: hypothetical protein VHG09_12315 [Longimicrobiales bacterium]|nr:hypothetical protein [Longimicrobiales bacterium]